MKKYIFAGLAVLSLALTACEDEFDKINNKPDQPSDELISPDLQLSDGIMSTGYTTSSGAMAWYASSYTEQLVGVGGNQLYRAEMRSVTETASSSTFNNEWNGTYGNILNLKKAIAKAEPGAQYETQVDTRGMLKVMLALNYGLLTDAFGDIPASEAATEGIAHPKLDTQKSVYETVFSLLDAAIADFDEAAASETSTAGTQDILYGGDVAKWKAFAYALKARYKLHLQKVDSNAIADALAAAQEAKKLGFEGAEITGFTGIDNSSANPWAAYWYSRKYSAASKTVADLLTERNDPRLAVYATDWTAGGSEVLSNAIATPGNQDDALVSFGVGAGFALPAWLNVYSYSQGETASIHLLSKAELYFILAETEQRTGADYNADLATAIEASFADYGSFGVTLASTADQYVASLASKLAADPLKEIMIQKYISQCRDEQLETFNDYRRLDANGESGKYVTLTNPNNKNNRLPQRLPYGNSDVVANPNVSQAYGDGMYVFTEKVWWAGGSR